MSRFHHLITDQFVVPTSDAIASREPHKSMIDLNDVGESVSMPKVLGPTVPLCKAILSQDLKSSVGHSVLMTEDTETAAESEWREQFRQRLRQAQGERTADDMAELLCISRSAYSKYVGGRGSVMPTRLLTRFCKICGVQLQWLIDGNVKTAAPRKQASSPAKPAKRASSGSL